MGQDHTKWLLSGKEGGILSQVLKLQMPCLAHTSCCKVPQIVAYSQQKFVTILEAMKDVEGQLSGRFGVFLQGSC